MNNIEIKEYRCQILKRAYNMIQDEKRGITGEWTVVGQKKKYDYKIGDYVTDENGDFVYIDDYGYKERTESELNEYFDEYPSAKDKLDVLEDLLKKMEKLI